MDPETDPIRSLYADHEDLVARLGELEELCRRAERGHGPEDLGDALSAMVDRLREEVDVHSNREELGLFPVLRRHPLPADLMDALLAEHGEIRAYVHDFAAEAGLWVGGRRSWAPAWIAPARQARGLLSTHMQKENLLLFPLADRVLTAEERKEVAAACARLDAWPSESV
jgi:regulator of cell morphogenesis and NO signaling